MSVLPFNIKYYGSTTMKDDDTAGPIGGAIDKTKKVQFADVTTSGNIEIISDDSTDTTQTVTVTGRSPSGGVISETKTLSGETPVPMTTNTTWERFLKATKSGTTAGTVAVVMVTKTHSGTLQTGSANATASKGPFAVLAATASASDDAYNGMVLRVTGSTPDEIREIIDYNGTTKEAFVNEDFGAVPGAVTYEIADGVVFDKGPNEVTEVRRMFYDASANPSGGATKTYYEKFFVSNEHATIDLTNAKLAEIAGGVSAKVAFGIPTTLNDTGTNGGTNTRQTAPAGITFASTQLTLGASADGNLTATNAHGVWAELTLAGGDAATNSFWTPETTGQST